jgi:hypothetical protein
MHDGSCSRNGDIGRPAENGAQELAHPTSHAPQHTGVDMTCALLPTTVPPMPCSLP